MQVGIIVSFAVGFVDYTSIQRLYIDGVAFSFSTIQITVIIDSVLSVSIAISTIDSPQVSTNIQHLLDVLINPVIFRIHIVHCFIIHIKLDTLNEAGALPTQFVVAGELP